MDETRRITLTELQRLVRETICERFPLPVWVSAEISEIKVNRSGHCYLELIEKGGDNGVPQAQARAVIWRSHYPRIAAVFEIETGQPLAAGLQILAKTLVGYHEIYGFSLQITDIDAAYTLGDMERQRQQTIARLQREGVWDMNRTLELPAVVQRIAVVSSSKAAGYQDFCNELAKSDYRFEHTLFEAVVQGAAAEESLVEALDRIARNDEAFDAVAILRGGGSACDLNCFNAYRLSCHVAQFPLPVLTGIGHDKDTSVVDMVAHTPLKTPTAVAAWLVERMSRTDGWLEWAALQLQRSAAEVTHSERLRIERLQSELRTASKLLLQDARSRLERAAEALGSEPLRWLRIQHQRLENAAESLLSHSVERVLRRGFAVVRDERGAAVTSVRELHEGASVTLHLADGSASATLQTIKTAEK